MPTGVNHVRLREHLDKVSARCAAFMDNFFNTCHEYDPLTNFRNYVNDIDLYASMIKAYQRTAGISSAPSTTSPEHRRGALGELLPPRLGSLARGERRGRRQGLLLPGRSRTETDTCGCCRRGFPREKA